MRPGALLFLGALLLMATAPFIAHIASGQQAGVLIVRFDVPVDPGSSTMMARAVGMAKDMGAKALVIVLNTPGGLMADMQKIIASIADAEAAGIRVYSYVEPNGLAASAGSYIAMATAKIIMGPGSVIGPSTPIVVGGTELEQNHTASAALQLMVSLAQRWGRNTTAVYYMVAANRAYSAEEAVRLHVADALSPSLGAALAYLNLTGLSRAQVAESPYEQLLSLLSNPLVAGLMMLLGTLALVLDLYHPTLLLSLVGGIAIVAGLVGAELIHASALGLALLLAAATLIFLELKLGHGLAVMGGIALGALGIYLLASGVPYSPSPITGFTQVALVGVVALGIMLGLYVRWVLAPLRRRRALAGAEALIGKEGIAITPLRPDGEVRVEGVVWQATSVSGEIEQGRKVRVKEIRGVRLLVERA
ncbi:MAG: Nodulation protein NfeD related protein [Nitrososphaerota archaeon]